MELKNITVNIFKELVNDITLTDLLEVPSTSIKDLREQIVEDPYPNTLSENNLSRLCFYEKPSTPTTNPLIEKGWVEVDVYVHKTKDRKDRRTLLIAQRVIDTLDTDKRSKEGRPPVMAGTSLNYYNRLPKMFTHRDWVKYGLVFNYDLIR